MMKIKNYFFSLTPMDSLVLVFASFLSVMNIIFHDRVDGWYLFVILNIVVILFVITIANLDRYKSNIFWNQLHYWYVVPLIFFSFKELYFMIKPIRGVDYDQVLINIDRFLFGGDPTVFLYQISHPILTELLQIVYGTFFFLPIILGVDLILNNRYKEFQFEAFSVIFGFFLSYIGYFLVPAIGPRFTLHDFSATNTELPGLFLTNYLRDIVNLGESITASTPNPADVVQRDVFPSGHTQMTLIVMYLSYRFKSNSRYFLIPNGALLIFSTVYLRYHYVIDLIGGALFMAVTMWSGYYIFNWLQKIRGEEKFNYP